jgi:hypothetical protein
LEERNLNLLPRTRSSLNQGSMFWLTTEQLEQFNRDGYLLIEELFDAEEMADGDS